MFLVLEGLDGAGKSTQVKQLQQMLDQQAVKYKYLHFPRFDAPVYGELIARFLRGELGALEQVDPSLVALIYAGDRKDAAKMIRNWLKSDYVVIVDRYVYSNIAYQCAKVADVEKRDELALWIKELEYVFNDIPKPDLTLFLDVPFKFTKRKLTETREGDDRGYLKGAEDIHEASLDLQESVRRVYLDQAVRFGEIKVVDCADAEGEMLPPQVIFEKIKEHYTASL